MQLDSYRTFLEGYVQFLEKAAEDEAEKYGAMVSYDAKKMNRAVSGQQAVNMQLEKLEQQREEEQRKAGFEGLTFFEILERLNDEDRAEFAQLFTRFGKAVYEIKFLNGKAMRFAQEGLQTLGKQEKQVASPYTASGKQKDGAAGVPFFETQI